MDSAEKADVLLYFARKAARMQGMGMIRWMGMVGIWARDAWLLAFVVAATAMGCSRRDGVTTGAQLRMTTSELGPRTGFELLLERPMATFAEVGTTSAVPPVLVKPAVRGEFVWRSRRSGIFRPLEPWPLGTTLEFRLRDGLKDADGKPVAARLLRRVETPPFEVAAESAVPWEPSTMPSLPVMVLRGNAAVDAGTVSRRVHFTDGVQRVAVRKIGRAHV